VITTVRIHVMSNDDTEIIKHFSASMAHRNPYGSDFTSASFLDLLDDYVEMELVATALIP